MTTMNTFFGPTADGVLAGYRRAKYASHTVETVAGRLQELCDSRDTLHGQHESEIEHQKSRVAATEDELEDVKQQMDRIGRQHGRLKRTLDSFWGRMGIRLRHLFSQDAQSLKQTRQRLEGLERGRKKVGEKVEYATRVWTKQTRALERLTAPIEDLEFAINYLEREKEAAERDTVEQNVAINQAIHQTVQAMTPSVLQRKLPQLAGQLDAPDLMKTVFRLRTVLAKSRALSHLSDMESPDVDIDTTPGSISVAITSGLDSVYDGGNGSVDLNGRGTTRVKKTRTRNETTTDSSGRPTTRTRTETYWDSVEVELSGSVNVSFEIEFCDWKKDTTVEALSREADAWFRHGVMRQRESQLRETVVGLQEEAITLASRIRSALESSTFA